MLAYRDGPAAPESDNARRQPGVIGEQGAADSHDCAADAARAKRLATPRARAALVGLALHEVEGGACLLIGEAGQRSTIPSLQAAEALVYGVEHVRSEVSALLALRSRRSPQIEGWRHVAGS